MTLDDPLIAAGALASRIGAPGLTLIDATWPYPGGPQPVIEGRIPGAVALDLDAVSDPESALPHMLAAPARFEAEARRLGLAADGEVVVYDRMGLVSAPRAWWMFAVMGHPRVRVLDGGLPAWAAAGGTVEPEPAPADAAAPGDFRAAFDPTLLADRAAVAAALESGDAQVLDVRSAARFAGAADEPRPGVRPGHMPGALNAPWPSLVGADGRLADDDALHAALDAAGVRPNTPVITTCGSGVTACIAALALARLGRRDWRVYDGSWAEWGSDPSLPVARDPVAAS